MLLELLLPRRCVVCGAPGETACAVCVAALPRLRAPLCERCGAPTAWPVARCLECSGRRLAFASARAAVPYDASVRALVRGWKERGLRTLAAPAAELVAEVVPRPDAAVLCPVPPDAVRGIRRGHHPAASLAAALGRLWELRDERLLERPRPAPAQRGLSLADRRRNVVGAFAAARPPPARVALVDDVYTTGATAAAAASALRAAGARRVEVVTFARAVRSPGFERA
jgi:predicted amidophosphoribosyltransferase